MAVTLNALTTGVGGLQTTGDTSGQISLQSNGSTVLTMTSTGVSVTGTLSSTTAVPIASGGTGQTTATAAFDALNPMTTGGDIIYESAPGTATRLPVGSTGQVLTVAGGLPSWAAAAGGQLQTEIFTAPGTWTKPSSATQVRVTVVGAGGAGAPGLGNPGTGGPGGTSSFGALVSATGGNGSPSSGGVGGANGTGTVTTGTVLVSGRAVTYTTGSTAATNGIQSALAYNINGLSGPGSPGNSSGVAYSKTGGGMAGLGGLGPASGNYNGGAGGLAIAICPVSAPVAVTVGTGGTPVAPITGNQGGTGGAVVVEFVG